MQLSDRIKNFRTYNDLSTELIANALKIDIEKYLKFESGELVPNIDELNILTKIYKISLKELYGSAPLLTIRNFDRPKNKFYDDDDFEKMSELSFSDLGIDEKQIILNYRLSKNKAELYKIIDDYRKENPDE